jgi:hypothetical protein
MRRRGAHAAHSAELRDRALLVAVRRRVEDLDRVLVVGRVLVVLEDLCPANDHLPAVGQERLRGIPAALRHVGLLGPDLVEGVEAVDLLQAAGHAARTEPIEGASGEQKLPVREQCLATAIDVGRLELAPVHRVRRERRVHELLLPRHGIPQDRVAPVRLAALPGRTEEHHLASRQQGRVDRIQGQREGRAPSALRGGVRGRGSSQVLALGELARLSEGEAGDGAEKLAGTLTFAGPRSCTGVLGRVAAGQLRASGAAPRSAAPIRTRDDRPARQRGPSARWQSIRVLSRRESEWHSRSVWAPHPLPASPEHSVEPAEGLP